MDLLINGVFSDDGKCMYPCIFDFYLFCFFFLYALPAHVYGNVYFHDLMLYICFLVLHHSIATIMDISKKDQYTKQNKHHNLYNVLFEYYFKRWCRRFSRILSSEQQRSDSPCNNPSSDTVTVWRCDRSGDRSLRGEKPVEPNNHRGRIFCLDRFDAQLPLWRRTSLGQRLTSDRIISPH